MRACNLLSFAFLVLALGIPAAGAAPVRCADDGEGGACVWGRLESFDGGEVRVRGLAIHLMGATVPSRREWCASKTGGEFDCGKPVRKRVAELAAKGIACDILEMGAGALIGRCRVAEGDLARLLVAQGLARAAKDGPFEAEQAAAITNRRGLWQADTTLPRDWEAARRKGDRPVGEKAGEKPGE